MRARPLTCCSSRECWAAPVIMRAFGALSALLRSRRSARGAATGPKHGSDRSFLATRLPPLLATVFGVAFILINAPSLPQPWPERARIGGIALALIVAAWVLLRPTHPAPRPSRRALHVYWRWVAIEAAAIYIGARSLMWLDAKQFGVTWVIAVVGVHFIPFAGAFHRPQYRVLGAVLIVVAAAGAVATGVLGSTGAGLTGVLAGAVLLFFAAAFGRSTRA